HVNELRGTTEQFANVDPRIELETLKLFREHVPDGPGESGTRVRGLFASPKPAASSFLAILDFEAAMVQEFLSAVQRHELGEWEATLEPRGTIWCARGNGDAGLPVVFTHTE